MAQPVQGKHPARQESVRSQQRSLIAMEETMREKIRELQEQRAAAMMTEIVELQKERDLALGKVKRLENKVKEVEAEAAQLRRSNSSKRAEGKDDLVNLLRQTLLEEQLLSSDLKRKLQSVKKQNVALSQQLQEAKSQSGSPDTQFRRRSQSFESKTASPLVSPGLTSQSERRTSLTTPSTPSVNVVESTSTSTTSVSNNATSTSPYAGYSPTVIARRYKLATVTSREIGTQTSPLHALASDPAPSQPSSETIATQTSPSDTSENLAPSVLEALTLARADIVRLQGERDSAKKELARKLEKRNEFMQMSESLQGECSVLREALTEFSHWVRGKLGNMEENMEIFRIIYSLHGSLSQEQSVLQDLQRKLHQTEQKVFQLDLANRHLTLAASEAEEKYQHSLSQIKALQERLSCGSLPSSPSSTHFVPPSSISSRLKGRQFSSPQLPLRRSIPASPLTTHTPSHSHSSTQDIV